MAAPDEDGFGLFQGDGVDDLQFLAYGESVGRDGHAAFGADVYGLAVNGLRLASFLPFEADGNAGVDANSSAHELERFR